MMKYTPTRCQAPGGFTAALHAKQEPHHVELSLACSQRQRRVAIRILHVHGRPDIEDGLYDRL